MFLIGQAGKAGSTLGPLPFPQPQPSVAIGVFARGEARRRKGKEGEAGPTNSVAFAGAPSTADVCVPPPLTPLPHHRHPSLLLSPIVLQPRPPARPAGSSFVALGALSSRHWLAAVLFGGFQARHTVQEGKAKEGNLFCSPQHSVHSQARIGPAPPLSWLIPAARPLSSSLPLSYRRRCAVAASHPLVPL
jgi:hypothetical protein